MNRNQNDLPEVNQYIKENNLVPTKYEAELGHYYDDEFDRTYLVVFDKKEYLTYYNLMSAILHAYKFGHELVVCKGEIKK